MLCALFAPLNVRAQAQSSVTIIAQAGLDGFCKVDKWLPVHITVENTGADINARVQTSYKNSLGGQTVNGVDIPLPATSRKEFFLYVKPEGLMRTFNVSVLNGNKTLARKNLNINCASNPTLFGVLADNPSAYTLLNNVRPLTGATRTAQLNISDLPDQVQGWGMLDALIISNVDTGTLTLEQKKALELWLANGGKLFVTGGIQWQSITAGISDFLPIQLTSTQKVTGLSALSAYAMDSTLPESDAILATGKVQADANILVAQNGVPVLIEKTIGFGKVYYFAADPGLKPLNDWIGMQAIYEHLLTFATSKPSWVTGTWTSSYQASAALATLPELALPSFIYVCCWLGLYITIIGPVNYFILRRMKRAELAWITVPVLVIIFTSLAYFSGYLYRGTRPILNRLTMLQAWQGVDQAKAASLIGVYSPSRTAYNVESQDQFLIFPFPDLNGNLQGNSNWLSLKSDAGNTLPDVRVEIGGMQSLAVDGVMPSLAVQHDLTLTLTDNIPVLKGSITNTSKYTLKDAVFVTTNGWELIGDIAPQESKDVSIKFINNSSAQSTDRYTVMSNLGLDSYSQDLVKRRHASFFETVTMSNYGYIYAKSGVYLMGWLDNEIPAPVELQDQEINATDTLLYFEKLTPTLKTEAGKLMLPSSLYSWETTLGDTLLLVNNSLGQDGYSVRFQPSVPVHFSKVDSLKLAIGTNTAPDKIQITLWNFETQTWEPITMDLGEANVPEAWQYVGMDGEILLHLNGDPNDYIQITSIDFVLMVRP